MITKKIQEDEMTKIEMKFYKYTANKDMLLYLIQNNVSITEGPGKELKDSNEALFVELEQLKNETAQKYMPENYNTLNYNFNFNNSTIEYN